LVVVAIAARYKGYRYPIEVIGHAAWLYHRFALSLRDVEQLMVARSVVVTYESIRSWCAKFGPDYAARSRRRRPRRGDKWHLDEVFVKINGTTHYLWRAVDQHGDVLDILVQSRRNAVAARRVFPQAAQGSAIGAAGDCHRQAGQLSGRCPRAFAVGDPSPLEVPAQPGRELPSAEQGPGTGDATLRLAAAGPTVLVCVGQHPRALSAPSASDQRARMANRDDQPFRGLETRSLPPQRLERHRQPLPFATQSTHIDCATTIPK
jgi:hypothetical protein